MFDKLVHFNLTVNVLALDGKDTLTFNGEKIGTLDALFELHDAYSGRYKYREDNTTVLYTDKNFLYQVGSPKESRCALKIANFGRDEIPHVNEKVDAIIAEYRAKAKAEDEEKARREIYLAGDKYGTSKNGNNSR